MQNLFYSSWQFDVPHSECPTIRSSKSTSRCVEASGRADVAHLFHNTEAMLEKNSYIFGQPKPTITIHAQPHTGIITRPLSTGVRDNLRCILCLVGRLLNSLVSEIPEPSKGSLASDTRSHNAVLQIRRLLR